MLRRSEIYVRRFGPLPCEGGDAAETRVRYPPHMRESLSLDMDFPIQVVGATKRFGTVTALDGMDLSVRRGEVHGFLGPNGAGKSTTIRALLGQIRLTSGQAAVFGADPWRSAPQIHQHLAYVPGDTLLWPSLTGGECIDVIARLQGSHDPDRRAQLIDRFELDPRRRAASYSKGNRQKVALIAALSTRAPLLLLDEPTSGLDPVMERRFVETIHEVSDEGRTVLLSSHILSEVESLCHRVTIIREGRAVITDSLATLRSRATVTITARLRHRLNTELLPATVIPDDDLLRLHLTCSPGDVVATVAAVAAETPTCLTVTPASLDDLFWRHYDGSVR